MTIARHESPLPFESRRCGRWPVIGCHRPASWSDASGSARSRCSVRCAHSREGLVETQSGEGTFVARRPAAGAPDVAWQTSALGTALADTGPLLELVSPRPLEANSLSGGYLPPDLQPTALLMKAMTRAQRRPGAWGTVPVSGLPELREWFPSEVANGGNAGDVVIATGGQAALTSALRAVCEPGGAMVLESPTYLGAIAAARASGLRIVPIAGRWDGPDPRRPTCRRCSPPSPTSPVTTRFCGMT